MEVAVAIAVVVLLAGAALWAFLWAPRLRDERLQAAASGAQILAGVVTAVGIVIAGLLYILEQQWSPRFAVNLDAQAHRLSDTAGGTVIVQAIVSITNQGRTAQTIKGIEVGAVGLNALDTLQVDTHGDLPGESLLHLITTHPKQIRAGETDLAYFEVPVSCAWPLVRVIVKVPQPPFSADSPVGQRRVYQRKVLVPVETTCSKSQLVPGSEPSPMRLNSGGPAN